MIYSLVRELLFRLEAEKAHELTSWLMQTVQRSDAFLRLIESDYKVPATAAKEFLGLRFRSPIGIAAGFDKNARVVPFLQALGFGFVEVGTVTLHPQPGNQKPRLF